MTIAVQAKDTLFSIAKRYGISVDTLKRSNNLSSDSLFIGQQLRIELPTPSSPTPLPATSINTGTLANFEVQTFPKAGFNQYQIGFGTPNGQETTGLMRDNYPSPNLVNARGVSYMGKVTFDSRRDAFSDLCQRSFYADVLKFISKTEGCFDAVNSYDKAIFSFGFIQFTGAVASGAMLSRVLHRFKTRDQYAFTDALGKYGIDVQNGNPSPLLSLSQNGKLSQGDEAYRLIANDLRLTGVLIASAYRRSMIRSQVEIALENYVYPAVGERAIVNFRGQNIPLNQVLTSEAGFALRIDLCVNRGLSGSLLAIKTALEQLAPSVGALQGINEQRVIEQIAQNDGLSTPKGKRTMSILEAGFGLAKG